MVEVAEGERFGDGGRLRRRVEVEMMGKKVMSQDVGWGEAGLSEELCEELCESSTRSSHMHGNTEVRSF